MLGDILPMDTYQESFDLLSEFMRQTAFVGLFDLDLYESGGQLYFNVLILRFGASGFAVTRQGINLPALLLSYWKGETFTAPARVKEKKRFINEKVCLEDYAGAYLSWKEYQTILESSDFGFIDYKNDPKPYRFFQIEIARHKLKRLLK